MGRILRVQQQPGVWRHWGRQEHVLLRLRAQVRAQRSLQLWLCPARAAHFPAVQHRPQQLQSAPGGWTAAVTQPRTQRSPGARLPVQDIKQWLSWLREDLGFAGLRLDFSKGYSAEAAREYILACRPQLAIGEVWLDCSYTKDDVLAHDQVQRWQVHSGGAQLPGLLRARPAGQAPAADRGLDRRHGQRCGRL